MSAVRKDGDDLLLDLYLQPRGGRDEVLGLHDGAVKVRIGAAPVDNAANVRLLKFLAAQFSVAARQVVLESGTSSSRKRVRILDPQVMPPWVTAIAGAL